MFMENPFAVFLKVAIEIVREGLDEGGANDGSIASRQGYDTV